jgi:hypothetical protein
VLKAAVLLLVLALVARRVLPRRRLPWAVPVLLVVLLVGIRAIGYLSGDAIGSG